MRLYSWLAGLAVIFGTASLAVAQVPQPQVPTTVQLPTFSVFTVQTTVSVPDSGGAYLGGINRGADSSTSRGLSPLRNRALGSTRAASGVSISATIIDHDEIDRALLAAAARRGEAVDPAATKAAALSRLIARIDGPSSGTDGRASSPTVALPDSLAAIREQNRAATDDRAKELGDYFAKARQAEAEGKLGVAKVYYQMVARKAGGDLQQQAASRLSALSGDKSSANPTR